MAKRLTIAQKMLKAGGYSEKPCEIMDAFVSMLDLFDGAYPGSHLGAYGESQAELVLYALKLSNLEHIKLASATLAAMAETEKKKPRSRSTIEFILEDVGEETADLLAEYALMLSHAETKKKEAI